MYHQGRTSGHSPGVALSKLKPYCAILGPIYCYFLPSRFFFPEALVATIQYVVKKLQSQKIWRESERDDEIYHVE